MVKLLLCFLLSTAAMAHEGAPYPILVDHPTVIGKVSVWTDPDVGIGTFIIQIHPNEKNKEMRSPSLSTFFLATGGPSSTHEAVRDPSMGNAGESQVFVAKVPFDREGSWHVEFHLRGEGGAFLPGPPIAMNVDVTPPGPSKAEFFIYTLPFLIMGILWGLVFLRRR